MSQELKPKLERSPGHSWLSRRLRQTRPFSRKVQQTLDVVLLKAYGSPSPLVRRQGVDVLYRLRRWFVQTTLAPSLSVYHIQGTLKGSSQPLSATAVVQKKWRLRLLQMLFEDTRVDCEEIDTCAFSQGPAVAQALSGDTDLIFVNLSNKSPWLPTYGSWTRAPECIRLVFDFPPGQNWEVIEQGFRSHGKNLRKILRSGFQYRITRDRDDFDFFYRRMYRPFILKRHQETSNLWDEATFHRLARRGFLMQCLAQGGQVIAADLVEVTGDLFLGLANGVLDGDESWLEGGALSALYHYSIRWCFEHRIRRYDAGEGSLYIRDGINQYKMRWGFRPTRDLWNTLDMLAWTPGNSPVGLAWMADHPQFPEFTQRGGSFGDPSAPGA
jgi:hypothetical protein